MINGCVVCPSLLNENQDDVVFRATGLQGGVCRHIETQKLGELTWA